MRILAIRGRNLASLPEFEVDLAGGPLGPAGLFAVTGPTGSGKSTILDALCLALYRQAPRLEGSFGETRLGTAFGDQLQGDVSQLLRRGCADGHAEVDFRATDGSSYRARWGYRKPLRRGAKPQEMVSLVRLDDAQVLQEGTGSRREFDSRILGLVGMSYEQFTRTVLLAQGRFAEFLRSRETDRADLLEKLTGTEIYKRISRKVFERSRSETRAVTDLGSELERTGSLPVHEREIRNRELSSIEQALPDLILRQERTRKCADALGQRRALRIRRQETLGRLDKLRPERSEAAKALEAAAEGLLLANSEMELSKPEIDRARELDIRTEAAEDAERKALDASVEAEVDLRAVVEKLEKLRSERVEAEKALETEESWLAKNERLAAVVARWPRIELDLRRLGDLERHTESLEKELGEVRAVSETAESRRAALRKQSDGIPGGFDRSRRDDLEVAIERVGADLAGLRDLGELARLATSGRELAEQKARDEAELARVGETIPAMEAAEAAAHRMLDVANLALSKNVADLRHHLSDGQPCPVCGSPDHPWRAQAEAALSETLHGLREAHSVEVRALRAAREASASLAASVAGAVAQMERIERQKAGLAPIPPDLVSRIDGVSVESREDWIRRETEEMSRFREFLDLRRQIRVWDERCDGFQTTISRIEADLAASRGTADGIGNDLDAIFARTTWREARVADPHYQTTLGEMVSIHRERTARKDNAREVLRELDLLVGTWESQRTPFEEKSSVSRRTLEGSKRFLQDLARERETVLDGRPWQQELRRLESSLSGARSVSDSAAERSRALDGAIATVEGALDDQEIEARRLEAEIERLVGGPGSNLPTEEAVAADLKVIDDELEARRERRVLLQRQIHDDDDALAQAESLRVRIERQRAVASRWDRLNAEIGSESGASFSRIAQQFTLETLLESANRELSTLAPRFHLRILPGTMHFGIEDKDSYEEIRPVQTLSGGESFLVSLALALALSALAVGTRSVETLFIDEGFGTLDEATLGEVVRALSGLQAQGRQVGVVTHVEELKDQIPARIEVVRVGPGRSVVKVVG